MNKRKNFGFLYFFNVSKGESTVTYFLLDFRFKDIWYDSIANVLMYEVKRAALRLWRTAFGQIYLS
jgi:hypothetical protein